MMTQFSFRLDIDNFFNIYYINLNDSFRFVKATLQILESLVGDEVVEDGVVEDEVVEDEVVEDEVVEDEVVEDEVVEDERLAGVSKVLPFELYQSPDSGSINNEAFEPKVRYILHSLRLVSFNLAVWRDTGHQRRRLRNARVG
ncbi:hypothetical protein LXG23DRAFT_36325 [Yarrowia lipolytica]|nr:hypothetical protein BKA91DRAFT_130139 [Yarrowia lipolytica]KAE8170736.1 hypothetical protein BKA90DRAFT_130360 [Yarrowia lipolytica]KAJ8054222.1 hypothetical protein LXG23DRAFT_36325 [Yarrowia lipolytica]